MKQKTSENLGLTLDIKCIPVLSKRRTKKFLKEWMDCVRTMGIVPIETSSLTNVTTFDYAKYRREVYYKRRYQRGKPRRIKKGLKHRR